jgi:hypothetical protein
MEIIPMPPLSQGRNQEHRPGSPIVNGHATDTSSTSYLKADLYGDDQNGQSGGGYSRDAANGYHGNGRECIARSCGLAYNLAIASRRNSIYHT